jgi:hypothetical protein
MESYIHRSILRLLRYELLLQGILKETASREGSGKPPFITRTAPGSSNPVGYDSPAWKRLIGCAFLPHEVIALIEAVFTSKDEVKMICDLRGDDAQIFINKIHEVCSLFLPN